ncbi:MAG: TonB-dependent receptor [Armatimonadetes bacterium]|nr:TonB-dependent receptor [Armatimonadota bacterium]
MSRSIYYKAIARANEGTSMKRHLWRLSACGLLGTCAFTSAQDLNQLGIDDLMNIKVTTLSKQAKAAGGLPAAIYVITSEDFARLGATSVPEVLRIVPGLHVARIEGNSWMVSIRGFNGRYANKLLVLVDGRSIYSPLHNGVHWDFQEFNLEGIERIEVIRGPGGILWGSNAVNGIINIITKDAADTVGGYVQADTSAIASRSLAAHFGAQANDGTYVRVYGNARRNLGFEEVMTGMKSHPSDHVNGGIRVDITPSPTEKFEISFRNSSNHGSQSVFLPIPTPPYQSVVSVSTPSNKTSLSGRYEWASSSTTTSEVLFSFEKSNRNDFTMHEHRGTSDFEFKTIHTLPNFSQIVWGINFRDTSDYIDEATTFAIDPSFAKDRVFGVYGHSEFPISGSTTMSVGARLEKNDYSGWEFQPNARVAWHPKDTETAWLGASRAVRVPSRGDAHANILVQYSDGPGMPMALRLFGNPDYQPETVESFEAGYRIQPNDSSYYDIAIFHNRYRNLRTFEPEDPYVEPGPIPVLVTPFRFGNKLSATTYGIEIAGSWKLPSNWDAQASYSYLHDSFRFDADSGDPFGPYETDRLGSTPAQIANFIVSGPVASNLRFTGSAYFVGALEGRDVPGYSRIDAQLTWSGNNGMQAFVGVQNLLQSKHLEAFPEIGASPTYVPRSFYGGLRWRY